jgi:hypothetical protein
MFKIVLAPNSVAALTLQDWDYIKAIFEHIQANKSAWSLVDYAIRLNALLVNIEVERVFTVVYTDTGISFWLNSEVNKRNSGAPPFMRIEKIEQAL